MNDIVEEIIRTIEDELDHSGDSYYTTKENQIIVTDAGYVYGWFNEYKDILRKRYLE